MMRKQEPSVAEAGGKGRAMGRRGRERPWGAKILVHSGGDQPASSLDRGVG